MLLRRSRSPCRHAPSVRALSGEPVGEVRGRGDVAAEFEVLQAVHRDATQPVPELAQVVPGRIVLGIITLIRRRFPVALGYVLGGICFIVEVIAILIGSSSTMLGSSPLLFAVASACVEVAAFSGAFLVWSSGLRWVREWWDRMISDPADLSSRGDTAGAPETAHSVQGVTNAD